MKFLTAYALSFIGVNYKWGGENPISGFDCSGLVQEILRSVGLDPLGDQSAQALYECFKLCPTAKEAGAIAFYGKSLSEISHVAFMIDPFRIVEAGGGGSKTTDSVHADSVNAFVRIRPYNHRKDFLISVLPFYPTLVMDDRNEK